MKKEFKKQDLEKILLDVLLYPPPTLDKKEIVKGWKKIEKRIAAWEKTLEKKKKNSIIQFDISKHANSCLN